ncbi:MAG TPA: DUF47 family protein [Armatimonadota bacterium]|jgi:hypothetical protein
MMHLVPRDERFFDLLEQQASNLRTTTELLQSMFRTPELHVDLLEQIRVLEHSNDAVARETIQRVHRKFVTPLDREDIHRLSVELEDTLDHVHVAAKRMVLYRISAPPSGAARIADLLCEAASLLEQAVKGLRNLKQRARIQELCKEVTKLERRGDYLNRAGAAEIIEMRDDPLTALKWKELFDSLENGLDRCQDVVDSLEEILLKNT